MLYICTELINQTIQPFRNTVNRHNMTQSVKIHSAKVHLVNGTLESTQLKVSIPSGMTGKQLAAWKKRNESTIVAMVESGNFGAIDSGSDDDVIGDNRARG